MARTNPAVLSTRIKQRQYVALSKHAAARGVSLSELTRTVLTALASNDPAAAIAGLEELLGLAEGASRSEVIDAIDALYAVTGDPAQAPADATAEAPDAIAALCKQLGLDARHTRIVLANKCDPAAYARGLQMLDNQRAREERARARDLAQSRRK